MRVLVDTNILISAALNSNGTPYKAILKAVTYPNKGIICDQNTINSVIIQSKGKVRKMALPFHIIIVSTSFLTSGGIYFPINF